MTSARPRRWFERPARAALVLACLWLLNLSGSARAHADLEQAKQLAGELEFEASLAAFDAALKSGTLTREELIVLLSERALVLHALRKQEELIQDFIWLSALSPNHRLDLRAPPDLTAIWTSVRDQGRGPLAVELSAYARADGAVDARASLTGTVPEGARARLWLRREGGHFQLLPEPELHESGLADAELAFYADALVLGGVVIPGEHGPDDPLRIQVSSSTSAAEQERGWASRHKYWLIGGAVVVVAAAVVTSVLLTRPVDQSDKTNLQPMVTF